MQVEEEKRILYETEKNHLCSGCVSCLRRCKVVSEKPTALIMFVCHSYFPAPQYHDSYRWPTDFIYPTCSPDFVRHFKKFHLDEYDKAHLVEG